MEADDGEEQVWSWGAGTDGQLATERLQDEYIPQLILPSLPGVASLACGGAHAIAVLHGGRVLSWGRGSSGQLGHGEIVNCSQPKAVQALEGFVVTCVAAGWNHSGFVTGFGKVFICGDGSFGQLGHGDYRSQCLPQEIMYFDSQNVEQVSCGMRHSLVLSRDSQVFGFGSGKRGQLGVSTEKVKSTNCPQIVIGLTDVRIAKIRANGDHSAALSSDGNLYTWGRGFSGALDECVPRRFDANVTLDDVALGWNHALLLTRDGEVLMLGGNRHGVLSNPQEMPTTSDDASGNSMGGIVRSIPDLKGMKSVQISAGAEHSAVVTDNGSVMTWGWGEHGQLGLGNAADQACPTKVGPFVGKCTATRVYCGSGFTFVLTCRDQTK